MKRLKIGSSVLCRLYNTPDKRFYGPVFPGEVIEIFENGRGKWFKVKRPDGSQIDLHRKEIVRVQS